MWTLQLYKQKYNFQNPLRQNERHVKALQSLLDIPGETLIPIVAFTGACSFKTNMPENVTYGMGYIRFIKSFRLPVLSDEEVQAVIDKVQSARLKPSLATDKLHVENLRSRKVIDSARICPACGSALVLRTTRNGANKGKTFLGCSRFPVCTSGR